MVCALQGMSLGAINLVKGILIMPLLCFVLPMALFRGGGGGAELEQHGRWMYVASWVISAIGVLVMADGPYRCFEHFRRRADGGIGPLMPTDVPPPSAPPLLSN